MIYFLFIVIFIIVLIYIWLFFNFEKKLRNKENGEKMALIVEKLAMLTEQNEKLRQIMDKKLSETHQITRHQIEQTIQTVQEISGQSAKQIADVVTGLTKLEETNKQVINFSSQLQNLQDILKNPKQRGVLGEYFLEETLKNVLPPNSYQMQYEFKDGTIVDAAIFIQKKIISVDSKFSLENYEKILNSQNKEERERLEKSFKQNLKNRIDETSKYIKPQENTMDFAFMFIPSEAIYYDLLINKVGAVQISTRNLIEYAFCEKRVIIVSPTSFLAYLQTVMQGLRALQIEESAKHIRLNVERLGKHISVFEEFMKKLGNSMTVAVNHYNIAYKELGKIDKDVAKITSNNPSMKPLALNKPETE